MTGLQRLLTNGDPDIVAIADFLDGLDHGPRLREVRGLGLNGQSRLFEAACDHKSLSLDDFVPSALGSLAEVVHHGKNSLPAFTEFAKVFCRPDAAASDEVWGYNRGAPLVEAAVGPGYFVAYPHLGGTVLIDYTRVPPRKPEHWPAILSNAERLSRFVYNNMQDVMRGVSKHVSIGRAVREGKPQDNWFVLCREDVA